MTWRLAADAVLVLHLAFIAFALFGGLLALRWRWMPLLHLPAAAWGAFIELSGRTCPLTWIENDLRRLAGEAGHPRSFVETYLLGVLYPEGLTREIQTGLAAIVVLANAVIYALVWRCWRRR